MPVNTARWVLWVSLVVLLPLPLYIVEWGLLPLGAVLKSLTTDHLQQLSDVSFFERLAIFCQCLIGILFEGWLAWSAGYCSRHWQDKIRGSVIGITVLGTLMVFSSVGIYSNQLSPRPEHHALARLSFLQVYP